MVGGSALSENQSGYSPSLEIPNKLASPDQLSAPVSSPLSGAPAGGDSDHTLGRRRPLPYRRLSIYEDFKFIDPQGNERFHTVGIGFYDDATPGEIFLDGAKVGTEMKTIMDDAAISISRNLQCGATLNELADAFTRRGLLRRALKVAIEATNP